MSVEVLDDSAVLEDEAGIGEERLYWSEFKISDVTGMNAVEPPPVVGVPGWLTAGERGVSVSYSAC